MYIKKILVAVSLLGLVAAGVFSYFVYKTVFVPNTQFETPTTIVLVPTDATYATVRDSLQGLLKDLESFDAVARRKGYTAQPKPGRYQLRRDMSNNDIVNSLRSQNLPVAVSFNNQESLAKLAGRLAEQIEADSTALFHTMSDPIFLNENGFNPETALAMYIPNTYEFYWNTSSEKFRARMLREYNAFWNASRSRRAEELGLSKTEVISLAAVVQKETARVDERPRVAGVYLNRLQRGILLQADPTVIYALKKEQNNFDLVIKRVLYKDLEIDSPYNTYKYPGIPPGPITMPDRSSIDAVLQAEEHDFIFFVADPEKPGYHIFAKTLSQHNRNKQRYVHWVEQQGIRR